MKDPKDVEIQRLQMAEAAAWALVLSHEGKIARLEVQLHTAELEVQLHTVELLCVELLDALVQETGGAQRSTTKEWHVGAAKREQVEVMRRRWRNG